ncbi:MAG: threonine--tRNA ligase [Candidatus Cloacimonetes bacterium]|nr:threonine--tRNA ligase [Candidatus Cloacimonadota bacterium]
MHNCESHDHAELELHKIRHSLAHILAQAVLEVRPKAELGFGPAIDTGFFYDFLLEEPLTQEDLKDLEKRMKKIIRSNQKFECTTKSTADAQTMLLQMGQKLKAEYADELASKGLELSFYQNGNFIDLCEGPHVAQSSQIKDNCFVLDSIAGSYWRGDSSKQVLTRIYGLAFANREQLDQFLTERKLAQERDHRKLGKELEIFHMDDEIGQGLPLWLPNGTVLREELETYAKEIEFQAGYVRVATPHITKENLYYTSGHLPYYKETMYSPIEIDGENYYLKPMNCPHHHKIYGSRPRSYRELPLRLAEYGTCYRYEHSGALSGLLRVRALSMNDAHIYCREDQVKDEFKAVLQMHKDYYEKFRIARYWVRLSLHASDKNKFIDNEDRWQFAEQMVRSCLDEVGIEYKAEAGEAAFYGPKVDFQIRNVIGREETASTNQLDFAIANRFGLKYTAEDGKEHEPYIIHRAPLGTHERFLAFLIEHFGGAFPTWMAPVQVRIVPVSEAFLDYAKELSLVLHKEGFRVVLDDSNDSFSKKIRNAVTKKGPNIFVIGDNEVQNRTVTWRRYCVKDQVTMPFAKMMNLLKQLRQLRTMDNFADEALPEVQE